jgi:C-terminal processing protease CtpA/Prc
LIGLKTFSSASTFAHCFKNYKMGTIIGQETRGWYGDKITAI